MGLVKNLLNKHTLSLASNAVMPVVGMLTLSLLAHKLSEPDFGNWTFFIITFSLANYFRSGFLQTSMVKFYSGVSPERAATVAGSTWVIAFAITIILGLVSLPVYHFYHGDPSTELTIKWFGPIFLITMPYNIGLWILQAEQRFGRVFILQLAGQGFFLLTVIILTFLGKTTFQVIMNGYIVSATLTALFALFSGWARFTTIRHKTVDCIKQMINFGKFSVGTSISSYLLKGSDTYIIKFMFNDAMVGIYYLPQRLMEVIEIPLRSFIATALPDMSAAVHRCNNAQMTSIMKKYAGILTILLIPVIIAAFISADLIIEIVGGEKFAATSAANIFRIFMCFAILLPIDRFFGISLDILNKPHLNLIKVVLMLVVNVAGDFIGIYIFHNIYGVAVASILTFVMGVAYGYWVLIRHLDFAMGDILKSGFTEIRIALVNFICRFKQQSISGEKIN